MMQGPKNQRVQNNRRFNDGPSNVDAHRGRYEFDDKRGEPRLQIFYTGFPQQKTDVYSLSEYDWKIDEEKQRIIIERKEGVSKWTQDAINPRKEHERPKRIIILLSAGWKWQEYD